MEWQKKTKNAFSKCVLELNFTPNSGLYFFIFRKVQNRCTLLYSGGRVGVNLDGGGVMASKQAYAHQSGGGPLHGYGAGEVGTALCTFSAP
jgi:hypothetical protein